MIQKLFTFCLLLISFGISAQTVTLKGTVRDADDNQVLSDATIVVMGSGKFGATGADGTFSIDMVPVGLQTLSVSHVGYLPLELRYNVAPSTAERVEIELRRDPTATTASSGEIPTIRLEEADAETDGVGGVANLLNASRDVFQQISGFGWFAFRFRERGYDGENYPLFINGVNMNDPETGFASYGDISGLNDVLRSRQSTVGLGATEFAFAEIGGATRVDTRASVQRKQIRASYALSNRIYRHRVMLTMNTGLMPGGWAVSLSGSHRWGQDVYFDGTFFDGYSWFGSVDKKFGTKHTFNVTVLGSPSRRGRVTDSFEEMYQLAGNNRYNPSWGYQNGEKRNSNVVHSNQPIGIFRYDYTPGNGTEVTFAAYGQAGTRGSSRIEWNNGFNPAPDYNRRLPSSLTDPALAALWSDSLRNNESLRQINWDGLYNSNRIGALETVTNADGIADNNITGHRSQYIVEDNRQDSREAGFNAVLQQQLHQRAKIQAGLHYKWYTGENFKVVEDLLGGDYWLDRNRFALQEFPNNPEKADADLLNPNNVVREGDVFGYNYDENIRNGGSWFQIQGDANRFSWFGGGEVGVNQFWRTGYMKNGRFPDNSLGDSEKQSFYTYGAKGGLTFKINGRNYLYGNAFLGTRPPQFRDIFQAPRTRDTALPNVDPYGITGFEGGYMLRSPQLRLRATGYWTQFKNEIESFLLYLQTAGEFGSLVVKDIERVHSGIELGVEYKPIPQWTFSGATNLGYYHYTNRPNFFLSLDNTGLVDLNNVTTYRDNFRVPGTPQTSGLLSVRYEGRRFWSASITANYVDNLWYQFDATRRTAEYVLTQQPGSEIWRTIIDQQKAPAAFTLDVFANKSWKIGRNFLYLNVGLNNILNNTNIIISGREAYRSAFGRERDNPNFYTNEITYAPGFNYFASVAWRM